MAERETVVERFHPTSGRIPGLIGLATAALILVLAAMAWDWGLPFGVAILCVLGALLIWAAMLRPAVWVTEDDLVMRNILHTDRIPLAAVDQVAISQVMAVRAGDRRFVSAAIGQSARQLVRSKRGGEAPTALTSYPVFVEERVRHLAQEKRDRLRIVKGSPEQAALAAQVRRTYAWPEIAGIVVLIVAFLIWLAL
jgi:hypothetical protein